MGFYMYVKGKKAEEIVTLKNAQSTYRKTGKWISQVKYDIQKMFSKQVHYGVTRVNYKRMRKRAC